MYITVQGIRGNRITSGQGIRRFLYMLNSIVFCV